MTESPEIDLRGTAVWDRPAVVEEALNRLPTGSSLTFITENEPRGLSSGIAGQRTNGYLIETRRVARKVWRVSMTSRAAATAVKRHPLIAHFESCAAFTSLDDAALDELAAAAILQTGRRGEVLVDENEHWPYVGMVIEGMVARAKGGEDLRERILYAIFPNELFGVAEYFDRGLENARIVAFSKTARIVKLPWQLLDEIGERHPELARALGVILAQRLRHVNDTLSAQGSQPIIARVAGALLPYAVPERGLAPAVASLAAITQSQIAAAAGTVKEVAARAIADLESRGALRRERGHIRYLDRSRLLELIREPS
ncbi:MAG TPA: helix-turn-helix domain-containing protein [Candidatus Baltobacteraceae bacterium]|nr:helix-turn-helix domain-containing protein [Candidatus Baltobacteraceae bacterium]